MHGRKQLVFGVNGYIGRHLAAALLARGDEVIGYDIQESPLLSEITYHSLDLSDSTVWASLDLKCNTIFWMAGLTGTSVGFERFESFLDINERALLFLLDTLRKRGETPEIFFPSTRLVYRGCELPLTEDAPKETKTIYAVNKLACENILNAYWNAFRIPYHVLRICVPYGSRFGNSFSYGTMEMFYKQSTEQHEITLWGDGTQRRTFTQIDDLVRQILFLADAPDTAGEIFNSAGEMYSLKEIAELFAAKYQARIRYQPFPELALRLESGSTVFNSSKLCARFNENLLEHRVIELFQ